jgi:hypothetical protein
VGTPEEFYRAIQESKRWKSAHESCRMTNVARKRISRAVGMKAIDAKDELKMITLGLKNESAKSRNLIGSYLIDAGDRISD